MSSLCCRCERIFDVAARAIADPSIAQYIGGRFGDYQTWRHNAETSSCQLCCILFSLRLPDAIESVIQSGRQDDFEFDCEFRFEDPDLLAVDIFLPGCEEEKFFRSGVRFKQTGHVSDVCNPAFEATWSWQSVKVVRHWLSTCQSGHTTCSGVPTTRRLPLRFLDVDPEEELQKQISQVEKANDVGLLSLTNMPQLKLCSTITAALPPDTPYLTLSHCWGRSPVIKLSHENLPEFSRSIDPRIFQTPTAATFRDAMHVTRCLGFRYLWIDALCINQEDEAEKSTEIMEMDRIYTHATLNISATAAQDGSGGLFFERDMLIVGPCRDRRYPNLVAFSPPELPFVLEMLNSPVNKRSWVFQERMLATRVLHFCRTRLVWECLSTQEAEPVSKDVPGTLLTAPRQTKGPLRPYGAPRTLSVEDGRSLWTYLVDRYATTSLTFAQDTLLALSAISAVVCRQRGLEARDYAAGLWTPDLPTTLTWRVAQKPDRLATEYVAPSWSWAALFCSVDIESEPYAESFVHEINVSITPKTASPFGSVLGGSLLLRGRLGSLHFLESEDCFRIGRQDDLAPKVLSSGFPGTVRDGLADKVFRWSQQGLGSSRLERFRSHQPLLSQHNVLACEWDHGIPGRDQPPSRFPLPLPDGSQLGVDTTSFFLLPVGQRKGFPGDKNEPLDRVEGLILHRCLKKGEYVRVGIFHYTIPDGSTGGDMRDFIFGEDGPLNDDSFLSRHDDGTCVIRII